MNFFYLLVGLNAADIGTTVYAVRIGAVEDNPLLAPLMARFGVAPALVVAKLAVLPAMWFLRDTPVMPFLVGGYAGLLGWNLLQIQKQIANNKAKPA